MLGETGVKIGRVREFHYRSITGAKGPHAPDPKVDQVASELGVGRHGSSMQILHQPVTVQTSGPVLALGLLATTRLSSGRSSSSAVEDAGPRNSRYHRASQPSPHPLPWRAPIEVERS